MLKIICTIFTRNIFLIKKNVYIFLTFYRAEEASEADGKQAKDGEGRPGKLAFMVLVFNYNNNNACKISGENAWWCLVKLKHYFLNNDYYYYFEVIV